MHGVSWRSGTHAPPLGIADCFLFVHCHRRNLGRNRCGLGGPTDFFKLLGISAGCFGLHRSDPVCLGTGTFIVVVQGASFVGIAALSRRRIARAACAYPAVGRGGAIAAIDRPLRSRSSDQRRHFAVRQGAPNSADCAGTDAGPQRGQSRSGVAHGRLADSAKSGAVSRHCVFQKLLRSPIGNRRGRQAAASP